MIFQERMKINLMEMPYNFVVNTIFPLYKEEIENRNETTKKLHKEVSKSIEETEEEKLYKMFKKALPNAPESEIRSRIRIHKQELERRKRLAAKQLGVNYDEVDKSLIYSMESELQNLYNQDFINKVEEKESNPSKSFIKEAIDKGNSRKVNFGDYFEEEGGEDYSTTKNDYEGYTGA